ncbi:hypothetical protein RC98_09505 [Pectobacterium carotovorum subsp. carotovorum]|nr:hypothetical protein RC98_09505 [Pectobacterium carotovorum subsp. carotovorum]
MNQRLLKDIRIMTAIQVSGGASFAAFSTHPGYRRMFAPDRLTIGIFLPLRFYKGDMRVLAEDVLPHFPSHEESPVLAAPW